MKLIKITTLTLILFFSSFLPTSAQDTDEPQNIYVKAQVLEILNEGTKTVEGFPEYTNEYQTVRIRILEGKDKGKDVVVEHGGIYNLSPSQKVKPKQIIIVTKSLTPDGESYQIIDKYRLEQIGSIALIFLFLVFLLSRWKGVGSFLGMILSLLVIIKFIVPRILAGDDPLTVSIIGSIFILVTSIYLAHGYSKQTTIAVIATSLTLILTGLLSITFVNLTSLSGLGNEDAYSLQFGPTANINFQGLLLGGMIIGFLGVLDDITTSLAATVYELKKANPKFKTNHLIQSSLNVGREHISSLVNTLVLAYAGASLPIFLFIVINPQGYPLWFILNSEFIAEEVIRTLTGSIGLLLAVPITTLLAAWSVSTKKS